MRKIIHTKPDGGIVIVHPVRNTIGDEALSDAQIEKRAWDRLLAYASNLRYIAPSAIPVDRTFRDAWRESGGQITVDMNAAKMLARNMLRRERAVRFKALDGQWMRGIGRGDLADAAAAEAKRETLRNWPQDSRINACANENELKMLLSQMKEQ